MINLYPRYIQRPMAALNLQETGGSARMMPVRLGHGDILPGKPGCAKVLVATAPTAWEGAQDRASIVGEAGVHQSALARKAAASRVDAAADFSPN